MIHVVNHLSAGVIGIQLSGRRYSLKSASQGAKPIRRAQVLLRVCCVEQFELSRVS